MSKNEAMDKIYNNKHQKDFAAIQLERQKIENDHKKMDGHLKVLRSCLEIPICR